MKAEYFSQQGLLYGEKENDVALECFKKAALLNPRAEHFAGIGVALLAQERYRGALRAFLVAREKNPDHAPHINRYIKIALEKAKAEAEEVRRQLSKHLLN